MTTIVAYTDGQSTWIGSDCASVSDGIKIIDEEGKWVIHSGWGIAISGVSRYHDIIRARASKLFDDLEDPFDLTVRLAKLFRKYGGQPSHDREDCIDCWGIAGLVAKAGFVWELDETLALIPWPKNRLAAVGSGAHFAMGAAWAVQKFHKQRMAVEFSIDSEMLVRESLECACEIDNDCAGVWQGKL